MLRQQIFVIKSSLSKRHIFDKLKDSVTVKGFHLSLAWTSLRLMASEQNEVVAWISEYNLFIKNENPEFFSQKVLIWLT